MYQKIFILVNVVNIRKKQKFQIEKELTIEYNLFLNLLVFPFFCTKFN